MNIFTDEKVAQEYDVYYSSEQGIQVDKLEKEAIQQLLTPITPGKMLEVGCGTGHWTEFFSESGFEITATDVSSAMLSHAKTKNLPNVTFTEANVCQLPFPDNQFDQVAVVTALEFCGNIELALAEIKRVLKPNGWLIAGCLNADSMLGKVKDNDPVLKHGEFMNLQEIENRFRQFGEPTIIECVHLSPAFEILDNTVEESTMPGSFIAAAVQKTN